MMIHFKEWFLETVDIPEPYFFGIKHLTIDINKFLSKYTNEHGNRVEPDRDVKNQIQMYIGELPKEKINKSISAIKYFLGELGIPYEKENFKKEEDDYEYITIKLGNIPKYNSPKYSKLDLNNPTLKKSIKSGESVDVRQIGYEVEPGVFKLDAKYAHIYDGNHGSLDFVDGKNGKFIWSIGKDNSSGEYFAAYDGRFHSSPDYELVWLR